MGVYLSIHFFKHRKSNHTTLLGVATLGVSLELASWFFRQSYPIVYFLSFGNLYLYAPFFLFFIVSLGHKLTPRYYSLMGVWCIDTLYKCSWLFTSASQRTHYLKSNDFKIYTQTFDLIGYALAVVICVISLQKLKSYTQQHIRYPSWLIQLVWMLLVLHIVWILDDFLLMINPDNQFSPIMPTISGSCILATMCWMGFETLQNNFRVEKKVITPLSQTLATYDQLQLFMQEHKAYTKNDLTLDWLSQTLGIPYKALTEAIHLHAQKNFYDYINHLRLAEFKRLLAQEESQKLSFEGLAKQAGFGSKTTFYAYFRKAEGMTPKEYQRRLVKKVKVVQKKSSNSSL
jgi:AraC-like DNA-binding protein